MLLLCTSLAIGPKAVREQGMRVNHGFTAVDVFFFGVAGLAKHVATIYVKIYIKNDVQ